MDEWTQCSRPTLESLDFCLGWLCCCSPRTFRQQDARDYSQELFLSLSDIVLSLSLRGCPCLMAMVSCFPASTTLCERSRRRGNGGDKCQDFDKGLWRLGFIGFIGFVGFSRLISGRIRVAREHQRLSTNLLLKHLKLSSLHVSMSPWWIYMCWLPFQSSWKRLPLTTWILPVILSSSDHWGT